MILLIDNYDSFTYNLYQYMLELGAEVKVVRNDNITAEEVISGNYQALVISPGPGRPENTGNCPSILKSVEGKIPVLGICIGHQLIGYLYGMEIVYAPKLFHGKTSLIEHDGTGIFAGLPKEVEVGRYHSLMVDTKNLPPEIIINARTKEGLTMGMTVKGKDIYGIQFHPESILTESGKKMIENFLKIVNNHRH